MSTHSKVIARTDRHTDRHDENITSTAYTGGNYSEVFMSVVVFEVRIEFDCREFKL